MSLVKGFKRQYTLMQQVEKFKFLLFTSDERHNKEIDTRIGNTSAVLREIYLSVVTKRELSKMEVCQFLNHFF